MSHLTDIEIARAASKRPIQDIGAKLGIPAEDLVPFGHDKAKLSAEFIAAQAHRKDGKLILVTAINPTPAGEGKTTTTVGLVDGLNAIGKQATVCIREASLGPCFGMKGGAAGGGYAQVVPMEDMNLHFTGDFHAITSAHNLLSAMIDNHIYWGNKLDIDQRLPPQFHQEVTTNLLRFSRQRIKPVKRPLMHPEVIEVRATSHVNSTNCTGKAAQ